MTALEDYLKRPLLGVAKHRLDLYEEGSFSGARVVCLGASYSECQWWCADRDRDCQECSPDDHPWEYIGSCRIADWINGAGLDETYAGDPKRLVFDEEGEKQPGIVSGLIQTAWTGSDYVWRFFPEAS